MIRQTALVVVVTCSLFLPPVARATGQVSSAVPPSPEAVLLIDSVDVSGTMAKAIAAMTQAEIHQLRRTLMPGDLYARIVFDGNARVTALQQVSTAEDVERIAFVLSQLEAKGRKTSISRGLIEAQQVAEREAGNRRVVLVLATDGLNDPPDDPAAEEERLAAATKWWRERGKTDRILVGIETRANGPQLQALATALDARLVTLRDYAGQSLLERAILDGRNPPAAEEPPAPKASRVSWLWAAALFSALTLGFIAWFNRTRSASGPEALIVGEKTGTAMSPQVKREIVATVTALGKAQRTVIPEDELNDTPATLGTTGSVFVPGLMGRPVAVIADSGGLMITVEPGTTIRLNGEILQGSAQPIPIGSQARFSHKAVAVNLEWRETGRVPTAGSKAIIPLRVATPRRSA